MTAPDGSAPERGLPVAFIGDAHLLADDAATTEAFVAFVREAPRRFARLVLVGDIFDLWIARPRFHETHHASVLEALQAAGAAGLRVDYAVGNRDFGVETLPDHPFERVASERLLAPEDAATTPPWVAEHGDLVNVDDRQYRRWRAFARSGLVLGTFMGLPGVLGRSLSRWAERRMRTTNLVYKRAFPTEFAIRRAQAHFAETGARFLVLGHFHQELRFAAAPGEVLVLPDWKRSRRHAEWWPGPEGGSMTFADSTG